MFLLRGFVDVICLVCRLHIEVRDSIAMITHLFVLFLVMYDQEVTNVYRYLDNEDDLKLMSGGALNVLCLFQVCN